MKLNAVCINLYLVTLYKCTNVRAYKFVHNKQTLSLTSDLTCQTTFICIF